MSDLLNATLGAVGQVGDAFDKFTGGRALRGLAAGKPRELLSVVPFSDTTGLTDAKDKTSGRDLTDAYGLTRKGDDSFGSHAIGFLADNALSPGNLIGAYGAFKAAPTLAKGVTQGAKALSGLDLLDHVAGGAKKLGGFIGGEAGSLKLPFDGMAAPPSGMLRSDPEWVNNRTFYHGASTPGISGESLDPLKTSPHSLYGRGIYTTDSPKIAESYANGTLGLGQRGSPSVYQAQSNFRNILDLDNVASPEFREATRNLRGVYDQRLDDLLPLRGMKAERGNLNNMKLGADSVLDDRILSLPGLTYGDIIKRLQGFRSTADMNNMPGIVAKLAKHGIEFPDRTTDLLNTLKAQGHDALTHTGIEIAGGPGHQVVIGLDPNGKLNVGGASPYQSWGPISSGERPDSIISPVAGGQPSAAFSPSNRGSGLLAALANRPKNVGETPAEAAIRLGTASQVPTALLTPEQAGQFARSWVMSKDDMNRAMAWYFGRPHAIVINGTQPQWHNTELMSRLMNERGPSGTGWFSSSDPNHLINHEIAHATHREGLGLDRFMGDKSLKSKLPDDEHTFLAKQVSRYSTTNPKEAVAELVAALDARRELNPNSKPELAELLRNYGGENLWQNLGDRGLLKGLGLAGLGMLGVGAATNPEMN